MVVEDAEKYVTQQIYPTKILLSFSLASAALGIMTNVLWVWMPFYYENVIGLPTFLYFIALTIFTVWDSLNELIAGIYTDKTYSFTKRWGRRFPFVLMTAIPFGILTFLVFTPPSVNIWNAWLTFIYFLAILFIYDGLLAFWTVSIAAIRSDKFRSDVDRRKIGAFQTVIGTLGGVFGAVTGGIFISLFGGIENATAYIYTIGLFVIIGIVLIILSFPGARDSEKVLNRKIVDNVESLGGWGDFKEFFKVLGRGLKNTNFRAFLIFTIANSVFGNVFAPSLTYFVTVVLKYEPGIAASIVTLLAVPFTVAGIVLIPLYLYLIKKYGQAKIFKFALIIWPICLIPFLFVSSLIGAMIVGAFLGAAAGLIGVVLVPILSDMIDEGSVREGRRVDSKYNAILMFVSQFGQIVMALSLWLIHDVFTDYNVAAGINQSPLATFGIRAQIALVPMIFIVFAAIYFYFQWKLTPKEMLEIKAKLINIGLQEESSS